MKTICSLLFLLFIAMPTAHAATCRAGEAAVRGGQVGYESDTEAADETADKSLSFADVLEQCVGSITGAKTSPSFGGGGLGDIVGDLFDKVCRVAREKISGEMADDRKQRMAAALANIYRQNQAAPSPQASQISSGQGASTSSTATAPVSAVESSSSSNSTFLQDIWR
jgi:hypothetical protein